MFRTALIGTITGAAAMTLAVLPASPALAHESGGDVPTAARGANVAEAGVGKEMSPVANLQYDDSGTAQSGMNSRQRKVLLSSSRLSRALAFAESAGFDRNYWGRVERGQQNVSVSTLARIARALDIDMSSILKDL